MRGAVMAIVAVLAATAALAQDDENNIDCAHAMVQRDLNFCADRDYRAADSQLNGMYRATMARLDPARRAKLLTDERAWIVTRDRQCSKEAAPERGGSIYPMVYSGCLTEKTKARIKVLQAQ
jgi:uncharacterized protein YecT (DUF1311 family)